MLPLGLIRKPQPTAALAQKKVMGMPLIAETESKSSGPYQVPIPLDSQ